MTLSLCPQIQPRSQPHTAAQGPGRSAVCSRTRRDLQRACQPSVRARSSDVRTSSAGSRSSHKSQCEPLLEEFCAEAGLPATVEESVDSVRRELVAKAAEVDAGYPDNADLVIDDQRRPSLKRRKGNQRSQCAIVLEERVKERMPKRTVLEMLARTAY
jgi:hypothetical protein